MNPARTMPALLLVIAAITTAGAAELVLQPAELRNLGITFERPRPVDAVPAVDARAHVVIPPSSEYVISSALPGLVARVHAGVGERVAAGQVLVEIRSPDYLTLQQEFIEALHFGALALAQLKRDQQLADEGIIADRRLEETRASAAAASGRIAEHRQLLRIAGMYEADLHRLEQTRVLQDTLALRAPIDGVILELRAKAGESVGSVEALYRMADLSTLWLDIHVPQEYVDRVAAGMPVAVTESAVSRPARVMSVGQAVDPATQTVSVRAELTESGHGLKPGQLVSARVVSGDATASDGAIWSIPVSALLRSGDQSYVFVRSPNGVDVRAVTVVGNAPDEVFVRDLGADAAVAVTGVSALKAIWLRADEADD